MRRDQPSDVRPIIAAKSRSARPAAPRVRRVSLMIAAVVLVCSLGGVSVSLAIAQLARQIDGLVAELGRSEALSRDLAHLESLVGQWLVSTDILFGHGDTHLWDGAKAQAEGIRELLAVIDFAAVESDFSARIDEIERHTERYVFEVEASDRLEILQRADRVSSDLVLALEDLRGVVDRRRLESARELERRRDRFALVAGLAVAAYVALAVFVWVLVSRGMVRPLELLTAEALSRNPDFRESGPLEVRALAASLRGYATALAAEKQELAAAERRSREAAARLETVMRTAPDPILLVAEDGRIVSANEAAERTFRFERHSMIGREMHRLVVDENFGRALPEGSREMNALRRDGSALPAEVAVARTKVDGETLSIVILHDLTEHQELELQLRQAQRLESVGRLAAGVAHEINTPIQFIGDSLSFLEDGVAALLELRSRCTDLVEASRAIDSLDPWRAKVEASEEAGDVAFVCEEALPTLARARSGIERVSEIVAALRRFTLPDADRRHGVDLNAGIRDTAVVAAHEFQHVAALDLDLEPHPPVCANPSAINQIVLNLIVNAAEAIRLARDEGDALGRIVVTSRSTPDLVTIEVRDDGPGIDEHARDRVFDPFFTTKDVGDGTGQGLAISRRIAEQHDGRLDFDSKLGMGTVFRLELPACSCGGVAREGDHA